MGNETWNGATGDWGTATDWTPGTVPNTLTANVTIATSGSNVTVDAGSFYTVNALTLGTGADLTVYGTLDFAGSSDVLNVQSSGLDVTSGGELIGAIIKTNGNSLQLLDATLDNVTYDGTLSLNASSTYTFLTGFDKFAGTAGTGAGVIDLQGESAYLLADDSTTLSNATLNFGGAFAGSTDTIYLYPNAGGTQALTLTSSMDVVQAGAESTVGFDLYSYEGGVTGTLVNQGVINAEDGGGSFTIYGPEEIFNNQGTIAVSNDDTFTMNNLATFDNTGKLTDNGAGTVVDLGGTWTNAGTISVSSSALLNLGGTFSLSSLASITNSGGTIAITGDLIDTGTLHVGSGTALGVVDFSGTITGGTVHDAGGGLVPEGGTLNGVTYDGPLDLTATGDSVFLVGGDTFTGTAGTGAGVINLTGQQDYLYTEDNFTLDNTTLNLGGVNTTDTVYLYPAVGGAQALTLGSAMDVVQTANGSNVGFDLYSYEGVTSTLVNQGTFTAAAAGGEFQVYGPDNTFVNEGEIAVSNGDLFTMNNLATFTNSGELTATGTGTVVDIAGTWTNSGTISVSSGALLNLGGTFTQPGLSGITNSSGTIGITGDLINTGGTLTLGFGSVLGTVVLSGEITGGTVLDAAGNLILSGGLLSGVTYDGPLNLTASSDSVYLAGADTFTGAGGAGPGMINLTGDADLFTEDNFTLDNVMLNIGSVDTSDTIYLDPSAGGPQVLTLGSGADVVQSASASNAGFDLYSYEGVTSTLVNLGTIDAAADAGNFSIYGPVNTFNNQGTIAVSNGDLFNISNLAKFDNTGLINASGASTVLEIGGAWANSGSISVSAGAVLELGGTFSLSALTGVTNSGGVIDITGDLINTSGTLNVGTGTALGTVNLSGTITGGTVADAGGGLVPVGGTLSGVTYQGAPLNLGSSGAALTLINGVVEGAGGSGAGTINVAGNNAQLYLSVSPSFNGTGIINLTGADADLLTEDNTTLNNATLNIGAVSSDNNVYLDDSAGGTQALTLGSNMDVVQSTSASNVGFDLYSYEGRASTLVNLGTIYAGAASGEFQIYGPDNTFNNQGTIIVANGDIFTMAGLETFTNVHGTTLTGGTYEVEAGSTLQLVNNLSITTDNADIILSGTGSVFESTKTANSTQITLDSQLSSIGSAGTLSLLSGRNFTAVAHSASFTDSGVLNLAGVTFAATALTISSGAEVTGNGTLKAAVVDSGSIIANGGSLTVTGSITGTGGMIIDASSDLTLGAGATSTTYITFSGTGADLLLEKPTLVSSVIFGFAGMDAIDLAGLAFASTISNTVNSSGQLVVTEGANSVTLSFAPAFDGQTLYFESDNNGGTDITTQPCFAAGTRIATSEGEVAVEALSVGDLVTTLEGPRPVTWLGYRAVDLRQFKDPESGYLVRIVKDAFAENTPGCDLLVTQEHCIFVDGGLIPARMLVNGRSIFIDNTITSYTYFHVELAKHGILLAEGLATESYLDTGNRGNFANAELVALAPDFDAGHKNWADAAAPLTVAAAAVEPVWGRLEARARRLGMKRVTPAPVLTDEPDLHLVTGDGAVIRPVRQNGDKFQFMVQTNAAALQLVSRTARPSETVGPFIDDRRALGVLVGEIVLHDGREKITIDGHLVSADLPGWFGLDHPAHRWTNGNAKLPVALGTLRAPAAVLEIRIVQAGPYRLDLEMAETDIAA